MSSSRTASLGVAMMILGLAFVLLSPPARADVTWSLSSTKTGDWSVATNWTGGVPTLSSTADIYNGGTATVTTSDSCNTLSLGSTGGGTLIVSGTGSLSASLTLSIGASGNGTLTMTGTGSKLSAGTENIGYGANGNGIMTLAGGTDTVSSLFDLRRRLRQHRDLHPDQHHDQQRHQYRLVIGHRHRVRG